MLFTLPAQLETSFFRTLNQFAEPWIRAGFGNPLLWPTGMIVIEVTGRQTERKYRVPVLATRLGSMLVCSTVRRQSQWIKNLAAQPEVRYWFGGKAHAATAFVITPENSASTTLPPQAVCLCRWLQQQSRLFGMRFAILAPVQYRER